MAKTGKSRRRAAPVLTRKSSAGRASGGDGASKSKLTAERRAAKAPTRKKKSTLGTKTPGYVERTLRRVLYRWILRPIWWLGLRVGTVAALVLGVATWFAYADLPEADALLDGRDRGSVTLRDRDGRTFAWRGAQYDVTRVETTSPHLVNAVIATEDKRFYSHFGLDPRGMVRAMTANVRAGRVVQGGSTITQQVAKILFFSNTRSLERHIRQVPIVLAMELKYAKDDILSIYLNRAYLGAGAQGFEAASRRYFGKSTTDLAPAEAAMLAGLLKAPSRYAPTTNINAARDRAGVIVDLMEAQGYLTAVEAGLARANPATLTAAARGRSGGWFADWVMAAGPAFLTGGTTEDVVIDTTYDPRLQKAAEAALRDVFETKVRDGSKAEAAIVVLSRDGAVRAMVGGRSGTGGGQFNRATQAIRQPGSAFKPMVYAAGLETGLTPHQMLPDTPITVHIPGSGPWSPQNYTRDFKGSVSVAQAFAQSINTVAVRVGQYAGLDRVRDVAKGLGIERDLKRSPALSLGASEVTLLELTGAYAGILNGGRLAKPWGMKSLHLKGDTAPLMGSDQAPMTQVISERSARDLVYMMAEVVATGTGTRAQLPDRPSAGKTGTTQAARDAWFVGFTGDYVAGVWMGYDDNTPLSGVTGGGLPAEIWRETMVRVHEGLPAAPLPMSIPPAVVAANPVVSPEDRQAQGVLNSVLGSIFGRQN